MLVDGTVVATWGSGQLGGVGGDGSQAQEHLSQCFFGARPGGRVPEADSSCRPQWSWFVVF